MMPGSGHAPYYFRERKWVRGLKPQPIVPPLESLVGKYAWLETDSYELVGPKPDHALVLHMKNPDSAVELKNVTGRIGGFSSAGKIVTAKRMKDENDVEYWQLEVTEDKENHLSADSDKLGSRFWRLYVGVHEDDSGFPFVEIQEVNGTQYAYGKRQTNESDLVELTDAEKERLNFLPVNRASLGRREYQEVKREALMKDEDIEAGHDDPKTHGQAWYMDDDDECEGLEPRDTVPPLEELFGRYAWAETGVDGPWGPCLKTGITLEAKDMKEEAVGTNVGGYLGELPLSGAILGAEKKKNERGNEYWELEVAGDIDEDIVYDSDDEYGIKWHLYVSKVLDDNGHPFLEVVAADGYSRCGGPYGYAKRQIPGTKIVGLSESEKERINFVTEGEREAEKEKEEEERKKRWEEEEKRDVEKKARKREAKEARKAQEERKRQARQYVNAVQGHNQAGKGTSVQPTSTASSKTRSNSQVVKKENSLQVSEASGAGNSNNDGRQAPSGQGISRSARKRANKRKREEEARRQQQQQATVPGITGYGGVWPPSHFQHHAQQASNGFHAFGSLLDRIDQRPSIKAEPMATGMVWEATSSQQNGNRNLKRKHSDDESSSKRVKREHQ